MVSYEDADAAIKYLVSTDVEFARAKTLSDALYEQKKTIRAMQFLRSAGSAAVRMEEALSSEAYVDHLGKIAEAQMEYETLRNKRNTQIAVIDMWRSVHSAQKKGNV